MKKKVLAIFKYPRAWNIDIVNRFSNFYETEYLYLSDYTDKNFSEVLEEINNQILKRGSEIIIFDVDYFKFINYFFIEKIKCKKKILVTGDDFELHEMNSITASSCDIILSHCPFSVLKFKEKGYEAYPISFEISNLKQDKNVKKEYDVLFFGDLTPDRKEILDHVSKNGISLKNVGHAQHVVGLKKEELLDLISKSKIVLNLSKSRTTAVQSFVSEKIYQFYYQFKGRIILAGLKGTACVSEYSPGQELLFNQEEIPTFYNKDECVKILKNLLSNENVLQDCTRKFSEKVYELWDDKKNFKVIYNAIEKDNNRKVNLIKFPYWYLRIAAKQVVLRNLKLSTFIKSLSQFKIIFEIIKKGSFLTKLLVLFEVIINTIWYTLVYTLKPKR